MAMFKFISILAIVIIAAFMSVKTLRESKNQKPEESGFGKEVDKKIGSLKDEINNQITDLRNKYQLNQLRLLGLLSNLRDNVKPKLELSSQNFRQSAKESKDKYENTSDEVKMLYYNNAAKYLKSAINCEKQIEDVDDAIEKISIELDKLEAKYNSSNIDLKMALLELETARNMPEKFEFANEKFDSTMRALKDLKVEMDDVSAKAQAKYESREDYDKFEILQDYMQAEFDNL